MPQPYYLNTGQYQFQLEQLPAEVVQNLQLLYQQHFTQQFDKPCDFMVRFDKPALLRRVIKPQISFCLGSHHPFKPVAKQHAFASLEWGLNWCIAANEFNHLIIHAAVLVKNGQAIIFPAAPGSGKSTLSAFFALNGWQLYSDEMAIIDLTTLKVKPLFRPVCLKNQSINLIKQWFPNALFSTTAYGTHKGDIAHVQVTTPEQYQQYEPASIVAVVFPKYKAQQPLNVYSLYKISAFERLIANAFNYNILGVTAFNTIGQLIDQTEQLEMSYEQLTDVMDLLESEFIHD
jgi:HprK-related kinase A